MDLLHRAAVATLVVGVAACGGQPRASAPTTARELPRREPAPIAAPSDDGVAVGLAMKGGALGAGLDVAVRVSRRINLRAGFSAMTLAGGYEDDGIDYRGELSMRSFSGHLDWFPLGGAFHLSPGVMVYNGNRVTAEASVPGGERFRLADVELVSDMMDPVGGSATAVFPRVAPSLVLGWGNIVPRGDSRWSFPLELGVVYTRSPSTDLSLHGTVCRPDGSDCRDLAEPALQAAVDGQEDRLDDELAPFRFLPVVSMGVGYKF